MVGLVLLVSGCVPAYPSACDYERPEPDGGRAHECIEFIRPDPPLEAEFVRDIETRCPRLGGRRAGTCPSGYVPGACGISADGIAVMRFYGIDERTARRRCNGPWIPDDGGT